MKPSSKSLFVQLREVLDDDPQSPRFIETVHRRGYRFIAPIEENGPKQPDDRKLGNHGPVPGSSPATDSHQRVVGREQALSQMRGWLDRMLRGERQIAFVTGEAGIGKTALVDTFTRSIASDRNIRIVRGQCLEQFGTSEAYLPVLEAASPLLMAVLAAT